MEKVQKIKSETISSLIYPLFLVLFGILSVGLIVTIVIPKFTEVFDGMGVAIPLSMQFLIGLGILLKHYGWVIIIASGRHVLL